MTIAWSDRMQLKELDNRQVHTVAIHLASAEVIMRTRLRVDMCPGPRARITVGGKPIEITSRRSGDWQTNIAQPLLDDTVAAILVDFASEVPAFYIVPAPWFKEKVSHGHAEFMAGRDKRPQNPESKHHRVTTNDVAKWLGCWDILAEVCGHE